MFNKISLVAPPLRGGRFPVSLPNLDETAEGMHFTSSFTLID